MSDSPAPTATAPRQIFPKVISASRATDLPAWYVDWFMERLRAGFCVWQNPFNAAQRQIVSFSEVRAIVFWSKNPAPLIPHLQEIEDRGIKFYFQYTLNDYENEGLEPHVPALEKRIGTFEQLARNYPVIWRYDPIVMGDRLTVSRHLRIVDNLMKQLSGVTEKLVFSFLDLYGRVTSRLAHFNSELRAPTQEEMRAISEGLAELRDKHAPSLSLATCAEADIDFADLEIRANRCIDPELINRLCGEQLFTRKLSLLGSAFEKDKGQRKACQCAPAKDIGNYRSHACAHHCIYCYAGHGKA